MPPSIVNSIPPTTRAAQYVRMSTEHQQYSPQNQSDTITKYAIAHNMDLIATYDDHGRSGLNLAGRDGLSKLLKDVEQERTSTADTPGLRREPLGTVPGRRRRISRICFEASRYPRFTIGDSSQTMEAWRLR